uniref:Uncharacterized protein n=1 Tax=Arion vulgaris TaxID=1028688 RepID=A0A0B7BA65_9EUPU
MWVPSNSTCVHNTVNEYAHISYYCESPLDSWRKTICLHLIIGDTLQMTIIPQIWTHLTLYFLLTTKQRTATVTLHFYVD